MSESWPPTPGAFPSWLKGAATHRYVRPWSSERQTSAPDSPAPRGSLAVLKPLMLASAKNAPRPSTATPGSASSLREPGGSVGAGGNSPDLTLNGLAPLAGGIPTRAIGTDSRPPAAHLITTYCTPYTGPVRRSF